MRTLIAHGPAGIGLLPDAPAQRAKTEEIVETCTVDGVAAAMAKFIADAGFDVIREGTPGMYRRPSPRQSPTHKVLAHELRGTTSYLPDVAALTAVPPGSSSAFGAGFDDLLTYRTSMALAGRLGAPAGDCP